jgi:2-polyprenyl-6-hydroxyphenyl methylase/3-demethylubiquinone-9 3-methyltransferase
MPFSSYHESIWDGVPEGLDPPDLQLRLAFLLAHAEAAGAARGSPPRVLDVGCGEGRFAAELARRGFPVVGVDVAEEPLRRARAREPALEVRIVPAEGSWPLADASFDLVWAGETIEHVADTVGWLSEVHRVLRTGGRLLLSTPAHGRLRMLALAVSSKRFDRHFDPRADHLRFYSRRSLARLLADVGFREVEVRGAGGIPLASRLLLASAVRAGG